VGHALVTSVRRRRRDLAVLKTLGFDRRQIRASVAWQATTLATVGLAVGVPAGVIVGGFVWRQVAEGLGISPALSIPTVAVLLVIPCAIAAVNLIGFFPARAAARTRPAVALRTE
jgi:ABC-type antimicrobial peptide transport system permease subunit